MHVHVWLVWESGGRHAWEIWVHLQGTHVLARFQMRYLLWFVLADFPAVWEGAVSCGSDDISFN